METGFRKNKKKKVPPVRAGVQLPNNLEAPAIDGLLQAYKDKTAAKNSKVEAPEKTESAQKIISELNTLVEDAISESKRKTQEMRVQQAQEAKVQEINAEHNRARQAAKRLQHVVDQLTYGGVSGFDRIKKIYLDNGYEEGNVMRIISTMKTILRVADVRGRAGNPRNYGS